MGEELNISYVDFTNVPYDSNEDYGNKEYTIDDCILVRTTDIFPKGGIVQTPIHGNAYGFGDSSFLGDIINEILNQKYPNWFTDQNEYNLRKEEEKIYQVIFETLRTTIHFTMNGLVTSHEMGSFDDRPYIILDPLKYHVDDTLKGLRVEDTYFNDDLLLSSEAVLLIRQDNFEKIKTDLEKLEDLKRFKTIVFKGEEKVAIKETLRALGYDLFAINKHGYVNGSDDTSARRMLEYIYNYSVKNNKSFDRHFNSEINHQDSMNRANKGREIDYKHLIYLMDNSPVSQELKDNIIALASNPDIFRDKIKKQELLKYTSELINTIGLDKVAILTKEFNDNYIQNLKNPNKNNTF